MPPLPGEPSWEPSPDDEAYGDPPPDDPSSAPPQLQQQLQQQQQQAPPALCRLSCGPCGVGLGGAPVEEQQQQPQQSQQQTSSCPLDPHQSQDRQSPATHSQDVDPLDRPEPQQSSPQTMEAELMETTDEHQQQQGEEVGSSEAQYFDLAPVEQFGIAASDSDCTDSEASIASTGADDAYWESELSAAQPAAGQPASHELPDEPPGDGGRPGKRHRPG